MKRSGLCTRSAARLAVVGENAFLKRTCRRIDGVNEEQIEADVRHMEYTVNMVTAQ